MSEDEDIISLGPKLGPDPYMNGFPFRPVKYKLTGEDDLFWYGIPVNDLSAGERPIPKFVWNLCDKF